MKTLTDRKIAEQEQVTYKTQQLAEETRKDLQQARAMADTQARVVDAERSVSIAEFAAQAQVKQATGAGQSKTITAEADARVRTISAEAEARAKTINADADAKVVIMVGNADAEKTKVVGTAEADVIKRKIDSMESGNYALVQVVQALASNKVQLVPQIVAGGGRPGRNSCGCAAGQPHPRQHETSSTARLLTRRKTCHPERPKRSERSRRTCICSSLSSLPCPDSMSWLSVLADCAVHALLLTYDRQGTPDAHRPLGRAEGRIQATGARARAGRRHAAASAAGATGAHDGAGRAGEARPRTLEHSEGCFRRRRHARQSCRRASRSASRRLRLCAAECATGNGAGRHFYSAERDQRRDAGRPGAGRSGAAQGRRTAAWAASSACSNDAIPPWSACFITRAPIVSRGIPSCRSMSA